MIKRNYIFFFFILYISLLIGFYFGENLNIGAKLDWHLSNFAVIRDFSENFTKTFLNYDLYGHRHSPVYLIFLSFFSKIGINFDLIRFIHLNISLSLIYLFFRCLTIKFKNIDKNILFLLSISIFLSPTFRSLAIWPDTRIIGLIFFTLSIYEFLKFFNSKSIKSFYKTIIFLILASYISPNFSVFIIFYLSYFWKMVKVKHIFNAIFVCALSSIPALYYIFVLDINFLLASTPGKIENESISLNLNFSNKIMIISTIILFHFIPFLINKNFLYELISSTKKYFFLILLFFIINIYFFDYSMAFTGGGFFFQLSNFVFKNNLFFYFFVFLAFTVIVNFFKYSLYNILLYTLLILSNIQNTIYHKYYDPFIMILFFLMTVHFLPEKFLSNKTNLIILYAFYFSYILLRILKKLFYLY